MLKKPAFLLFLLLPLCAFSGARDLVNTYDPQPSTTPPPMPQEVQPTRATEDITPSVGPLMPRGVDVVVDLEFLYWVANVTNLPYARTFKLAPLGDATNPTDATLIPVDTKNFDWEWDPGLRVGLGVVTNHDGWDVYGNWTYYHNHIQDVSSVPDYPTGDFVNTLFNPIGTKILTTPWVFVPHRDHYNRVKGDWKLFFNQIDLTLGRHYWVSPRVSFHPFAGARGYWARMHFAVEAFRPFLDSPAIQNQITAHSLYKQSSWGMGLLGGLNGNWHFTDHWGLFGTADLALTYGKHHVRRRNSYLQIQLTQQVPFREVDYRTSDVLYRLQTFIDLGLGIRWEKTWEQKCHLLFDLGWESHFLLNFSQIFVSTFQSDATTDLPSTKGNLTLTGIVARGRIEF